jgi:hypothetical protein
MHARDGFDLTEKIIIDGRTAELVHIAQSAALRALQDEMEFDEPMTPLEKIAFLEAARALSKAFPQAFDLAKDLQDEFGLSGVRLSEWNARRN